MNKRIKEIRQYYSLTQEEFGKKIGLKQNSIALAESGKRNLSKRSIRSLCEEFDVNENWLRTGEGEMKRELSHEEEISNFLKKILVIDDDKFQKRLVLYLAQIKDSDWDKLEQVLDMLLDGKDTLFPTKFQNKQ